VGFSLLLQGEILVSWSLAVKRAANLGDWWCGGEALLSQLSVTGNAEFAQNAFQVVLDAFFGDFQPILRDRANLRQIRVTFMVIKNGHKMKKASGQLAFNI
jgi:hypothetical protein